MISQKEMDSLFLGCRCGCGNVFALYYLDGSIYLHYSESFKNSAYRPFRSSLSRNYRLLRGKKYIGDVILNKEDVIRLIDWLETHPNDNSEETNSADFDIDLLNDDPRDATDSFCDLIIQYTGTKWGVITGQVYKAGEIVLDNRIKNKLLANFKQAVKGLIDL